MKPLIEWNNTYTPYPDDVCIHQLFEQQVERTPEAIAIVFEDKQLTYQQLNNQANQLAHYLRKLGIRREILVGICIERSIEMIVGLLGILKAGGAYLPLDPTYPEERLNFMLEDAKVQILLTQQHLQNKLLKQSQLVINLDNDWKKITKESTENLVNSTTPEDLIYVIYTSGTTGKPKGVMILHRGVVRLTKNTNYIDITTKDVFLQLAPLSFDASTFEIWACLLNGAKLVIMPPHIPSLQELGQAVQNNQITILWLTAGLFHLMVENNLNSLKSVRKLLAGGDVLSVPHVKKLINKHKNCLLINGYGPTENTTFTCCYAITDSNAINKSVPIGYPINNTQVYVLDKQMQQVEIGVAGELYIGGDGLARAYLNHPKLTKEKFINTPNGRLYKSGDLARYCSDGKLEFLGRIDNQVKIRGFRIELEEIEAQLQKHPGIENAVVVAEKDKFNDKQLVAYLVYQAALERVPMHSACVVEFDNKHQIKVVTEEISPTGVDLLGMPDDCKQDQQVRLQLWLPETDNNLWVEGKIAWIYKQRAGIEFNLTPKKQDQIRKSIKYIQEKKGLANTLQNILVEHLRDFLQKTLPSYMIPSHFVILDSLPLTANGKIDRQALPAPESFQTYSFIQEKLIKIWSEFLPQKVIGIHDNFLALGGNSLLATRIISRINEELQINLALYSLFETPTIAELSKQIETQTKQESQSNIKPASRNDEIPLSFAQQQLWLVQQLIPESMPVYNEPISIHLGEDINAAILEQSIKEIIQRHEAFRTTFKIVEGKPVQIISPSISFALPLIDLTDLPANERETKCLTIATKEAKKPFDLLTGPLFRATLIKLDDQDYRLFLTWHHIIMDGVSIYNIFLPELESFYKAFSKGTIPQLETPHIQYADYAIWQQQQLPDLDNQLKYWKQQLADLPKLQLPTDHSRTAQQSYNGARECLALSKKLTESLKELSKKEGVTLFMTLLAAFKVLLYRYTGEEDISVGTVTAGRNKPELEQIFGFFLNTLVLRTDLSKQPSFQQLLKRVREVTLEAYTHEDLPFEKLVEELQPDRNLGTNPLFQVSFIMEPMILNLESGWTPSQLDIHTGTSKFDLTVELDERAEGIIGRIEYNTDLFDQSSIIRMIGHYQTLLESIITNSQQSISHLTILTEQEQQQFREWNNTSQVLPEKQCIHQLFEEQVERTPEAIALVFENQELTYQQLNQRANQLAHYLRKLGVKPETLVGICVERSLEMIIGILGIIKAGGAYVPLDPTYPEERLNFMLEDAKVEILLTQQHLENKLPTQSHINLDSNWEKIAQESTENPVNNTTPDNLVYVIYTSGSTGKPKGVMIEHCGLCNLATTQMKLFNIQANHRVLQFASISFDASIWEIVMALIAGASLYLGTRNTLLPGSPFIKFLREKEITTVTLPPSVLATLPVEENLTKLQTIIVAGESCSSELIANWAPSRNFYNAYGPTEATVCATIEKCTNNVNEIPTIGTPIANTQIYILDKQMKPVEIGVAGELYIGSVGLARAYLNRPELTNKKFINTPNGRLYKSGDLARYRSDGKLEFLGRIDNQVKIRGFRIELGEIEAVLKQHAAIQEAAVVTTQNNINKDKKLVAYFTTKIENTISTNELRSFMQEKLPNYMIPSVFVLQKTLPLLPNGKLDKNSLSAPFDNLYSNLKESFVAPRNPLETLLAEIWAKLLQLDKVGIYDNFFELGGNSLLAVQVITKLQKILFVELPIKYLFEKPTIEELAKIIKKFQQQDGFYDSTKLLDFNAEAVLDPKIYPKNQFVLENITKPRNIFITGSTGFLGAYLIDELLKSTDAKIYCLIRAANEREALKRLHNNLDKYNINYSNLDSRLIPISGDLEQPMIGLSFDKFEILADEIDIIYHNGAQVNFAKPYSVLKAANVLGTQEVLRLACSKKVKPVHYISTLAVFSLIGCLNFPKVITEEYDINNHKTYLEEDIGYSQTKWVAEQLIWSAKSRGIPITVFRTGFIMGHSKTGHTYTNHYIFKMIQGCIQTGYFPNLVNQKYEFIPVDYASKAIVYLSIQHQSLGKAFHIVPLHSQNISLINLFEMICSYGYKLNKISYQQWIDKNINNFIYDNNPLLPFLPLLTEKVKGNLTRMEWYQNTPDIDCQNTLNGLANTSISCPPMNAQLIDTYLSYLIQIGFIEPPPSKNDNAILTNNVALPKVSHLEY